MSTLFELRSRASQKESFLDLQHYVSFAQWYLEFVGNPNHIQAEIVSQNESHYRFLQYKEDGSYSVTRPINTRLFYNAEEFGRALPLFWKLIKPNRFEITPEAERELFNRVIYTVQQTIGATLDSLPNGESNKARKINGDLFERLVQLLLCSLGIDCTTGTVKVPIVLPGAEPFAMRFQHDLVIKSGELVKIIGSVKTSSKDRLGKIFVDKFLLRRMTGHDIPHVAIFLNDVQRKGKDGRYGVSATFLPGHFKGYTVKINPLDGVYYCDIRPNMLIEPVLRDHIRTFDRFIFDDLRMLVERDAIVASVVRESPED